MPTSCKKNAAHIISDNEGKTIDINIPDPSAAESQQLAPTATVAATVAASDAAFSAPLLPSAPTTCSNQAYNINYFFMHSSKTTGTSTMCKTCQ